MAFKILPMETRKKISEALKGRKPKFHNQISKMIKSGGISFGVT